MRSTLDSTRVSTRSTVAARASMGKQQAVAAAAPAAPTSKPTSSIDSKERWATSTLPVAARVFSTVDPKLIVDILIPDGSRVCDGALLICVEGKACSILAAERTLRRLGVSFASSL